MLEEPSKLDLFSYMPLTSLGWHPMGATLDRNAAIGQRAITISVVTARGRPCGAGRCAARMGTQTAHAHLHGIECVERLTLYSLLAEASARC